MESTANPLIIGAGPAGLTAGLDLVKKGVRACPESRGIWVTIHDEL